MQIRRAVIWSTVFAVLTASVSHAQKPKDAAYLCTTEMAVGFEYNKSINKWQAVTVGSDSLFSNFTLRLKRLRDRVQRNPSGENEDVTDYLVTITGKGTNAAVPCTFGGSGIASKIIIVGDNNNVVCTAKRHRFTFNVESHRFISVFLYGYVDGEDDNDDMPMMSGGTCEKD